MLCSCDVCCPVCAMNMFPVSSCMCSARAGAVFADCICAHAMDLGTGIIKEMEEKGFSGEMLRCDCIKS